MAYIQWRMHIPESLQPIGDRVVVKTDPRPTSSGGINLTAGGREKMRTATVIAGPQPHWKGTRWVVPDPDVKPGARVLLTKLSVKSEDYSDDGMVMVVKYEDIGAVEE